MIFLWYLPICVYHVSTYRHFSISATKIRDQCFSDLSWFRAQITYNCAIGELPVKIIRNWQPPSGPTTTTLDPIGTITRNTPNMIREHNRTWIHMDIEGKCFFVDEIWLFYSNFIDIQLTIGSIDNHLTLILVEACHVSKPVLHEAILSSSLSFISVIRPWVDTLTDVWDPLFLHG